MSIHMIFMFHLQDSLFFLQVGSLIHIFISRYIIYEIWIFNI